jgi:hypothetical protein
VPKVKTKRILIIKINNKMKKYDLVIKTDLVELIETVNEAIAHGYYPKGGMTIYEGKFIQTIYLRDSEVSEDIK